MSTWAHEYEDVENEHMSTWAHEHINIYISHKLRAIQTLYLESGQNVKREAWSVNPFSVIVNNNILFTITEKGFTVSRFTLCPDSNYKVWPGSKMALSLWEIYIYVVMCSFTTFSCAHVLMCSFTTFSY